MALNLFGGNSAPGIGPQTFSDLGAGVSNIFQGFAEETKAAGAAAEAASYGIAATLAEENAQYTAMSLQFNGLSQAVAYGDDSQTATNYPLVRIINKASGHVRYCRTFNHTTIDANGKVIPSMGVATDAAVITTNVAIPDDIENGDSSLFLVANGIPSKPFDVAIWPIIQ